MKRRGKINNGENAPAVIGIAAAIRRLSAGGSPGMKYIAKMKGGICSETRHRYQ